MRRVRDGRLEPAARAIVWRLEQLLPRVSLEAEKLRREIVKILREQIPCNECIDGWIPGDTGIERCDTCTRFADDDEATAHVANLIRTLVASYGPDDPLDVVIQRALREEGD